MTHIHSSEYSVPFVGRAKELAEISARLQMPDCRLLTLTGPGGSGKTRLALEVASNLAPAFAHGSVFVALQPVPRSELLVPAIAQALGLTFYGGTDLFQQMLDYLRDKRLLLILDNLEHLLDGVVLVSTLLARAPGVQVLATSREALRLQEEWLYPLHGLASPPSVYAAPLEDYDAVQLFLSHARRVQPEFDVAAEHEALVQICTLTAGLPLAIELAASWLKGSSAAQIAQEMQRNLDFLSTTTRNVEERHRSMRAVFDHSWSLLSEHERLIFAKLCVFARGFDREAAVEVAEASFASLAALVEKSLIQLDAAGRFGIHELLRQYGMERLDAFGETDVAYARHSQYFARLMQRHECALEQAQQIVTVQAIEREFDNIRLAWEWSAKQRELPNLYVMLNSLYQFGFLRGRYREMIALFELALEHSMSDASLHGRLLARRWGYLHWLYHADYHEALESIEQALAIAQADDNRFEIAFCHLMAGYAMISLKRYPEALPHLETSHALFEALNEPYYVCWVLHRLGYAHYNLRQFAMANAYTEQSLALARATKNRVALVICLYNLGSDYIMESDFVKGQQYCLEALQIATESGHRDQIAHAASLLALCALCMGDFAACRDYAERSWKIIEDINSPIFEPYSRALLVLLACLREEYAEGVRLNAMAGHTSTNLMGLQLHYWALAALSCGLGHPADARAAIQAVLEMSDPELHTATTAWLAPCVAYVLAECAPEKAVELLAWVYTDPASSLSWARRWPMLERLRGHLHDLLDAQTYHRHWQAGKALGRADITRYLYSEFGAAPTPGAAAAHQQVLTDREREILGLIAAGLTNPQIAAKLIIGAGTVKTHTLNIYRKLEVANRTQAIVRAQELGLLAA